MSSSTPQAKLPDPEGDKILLIPELKDRRLSSTRAQGDAKQDPFPFGNRAADTLKASPEGVNAPQSRWWRPRARGPAPPHLARTHTLPT